MVRPVRYSGTTKGERFFLLWGGGARAFLTLGEGGKEGGSEGGRERGRERRRERGGEGARERRREGARGYCTEISTG